MIPIKVENCINLKLKRGPLHFTLIDPDPKKISSKEAGEKAAEVECYGSSAIMVGGSTGVTEKATDALIKSIKKKSKLPVILFPGNVRGVSRYADAIFFMSLMNSKNPVWITGMQAMGSGLVRKYKIEALPMAYLVVEPGMKAGQVGQVNLIKRKDSKVAVGYALAAQYFGMKLVYLEAGSGAPKPIPEKMIREVKKNIEIPLIVGGGIRKPKQAKKILKAGADIIVTGAITEENFSAVKGIIEEVNKFKRGKK